jgi:LmbE family N-acetylglucosaminyl deacetylase
LVIVAHPDDETFWAGLTLATGEWAAAVLTHRSTSWRNGAFRSAMQELGAVGAIFDLPDKHWGPLDAEELANARALIERLLRLPGLTDVMTHSPDGETGHSFHKLISELVTELVPTGMRLHYFSFDETFNAPRDSPELWALKNSANSEYIKAMPMEVGNDALHIKLSEFERPVLASQYQRPAELLRMIYAGSSVPNADIPDLNTSE